MEQGFAISEQNDKLIIPLFLFSRLSLTGIYVAANSINVAGGAYQLYN